MPQTDITIGSVWECRQDGRCVVVKGFLLNGSVQIRATFTGKETIIRREQFERRYRFLAESRRVCDIYRELT